MFSSVVGLDVMASTAYKHNVTMSFEANDPATGKSEASHVNGFEFKQQPIAMGVTFYPRGARAVSFNPYLGLGTIYTRASLKLHDDTVEFMRNNLEKEIKANSWWSDDHKDNKRKDLNRELDYLRETTPDLIRDDNWGAYVTLGAEFKLTDKLLLSAQVRSNFSASDFLYLSYTSMLGYKF